MNNFKKNDLLKVFDLRKLSMTSSMILLSTLTVTEASTTDSESEKVAQKIEIKQSLNEHYEIVEIKNRSKEPDAYRHITRSLPTNVFPILPTSYRWTKKGEEYVVMKHKAAPFHELEFAVFTDNLTTPSKVNYITLIDNVNIQSFAYTRDKTFRGKRDPYSFDVREPSSSSSSYNNVSRSEISLKQYTDGHCIDHADTLYPEVLNKYHSSVDPRNHIPEPFKSHWGLQVRNRLVADIRKQEGCYMQLPYYSVNSPKTNLETPVPEGIYFTRFTNNEHLITPTETYHIPWDDPIHSPRQSAHWTILLEEKKVSELTHGYLPYIDSGEQCWEQSLENLVSQKVEDGTCQIYNVRFAENLKIAADWETENIDLKIRYLNYSYDFNQNSPETSYWQDRALHHAGLLLEFGNIPISSSIEAARAVMKQSNEKQYDWWKQILDEQEELLSKEIVLEASPPEKNRFELRAINPNAINTNPYKIIFGCGKGSLNKIKYAPPINPDDILSSGKIWLKKANSITTKKWLSCNREILNLIDKNLIEIYYTPRTKTSQSHQNIENALKEEGFAHIRKSPLLSLE